MKESDVDKSHLADQPTDRPTNKVVASTGGSVVGVALAQILAHVVPGLEDVESALAIVLGAALAFLGGYFRRDRII